MFAMRLSGRPPLKSKEVYKNLYIDEEILTVQKAPVPLVAKEG
jgi:hypothetical protein